MSEVTVKHHRTSSLFEVTIVSEVEVSHGVEEEVTQVIWLDYEEFDKLKDAINAASSSAFCPSLNSALSKPDKS